MKWFAAMIFILFGIIGLYDSLPESLLTPPVIAGGASSLSFSSALSFSIITTGSPNGIKSYGKSRTVNTSIMNGIIRRWNDENRFYFCV